MTSMRMGPMLARLLVSSLALLGLLRAGAASASSDDKVPVEFYSESLCPYCSNFVVHGLSKIFDNGLIDIIDLRIIPYGNAHVYPNGQMICQHGVDECKLNIIQTCAISLWPNVTEWFPFIFCLEKLVEDVPRSEVFSKWKSCPESSGLSLDILETCFEGPLGEELELKNAEETAKLYPPHVFVPWVVVNGTPLIEDYADFETYVCRAYKGDKPEACSKHVTGSNDPMIKDVIHSENREEICNVTWKTEL